MLSLIGFTVCGVRADSIIMFNELMYHPVGNNDDLEWVELFNALSYDMDISGWELDGGIEFTFPDGTIIPADGYLVVAKSPAALEAASGITNVYGPFDGKLSNGGESIRLENNSGRDMDELTYGDGGAWPIAPDGSGVSLAKIKPVSFSDHAENWHAGNRGGTPGKRNFPKDETLYEVNRTTLIETHATWKYRDLGTDPGTSWMLSSYNDNSWSSGPAELGYGDGGESTEVSFGGDVNNVYPTTYFRHAFQASGIDTISSTFFSAMMDDGAVFYLNGTEFARVRMDQGTITYLDYANDSIGGVEEGVYEAVVFPKSLLVEGENLLAVEIHQQKANSSDISFAAELKVDELTELPPAAPVENLLIDPELVINEIEGVTNENWWIELKNLSGEVLDPAGYRLSIAGDPAREYELSGPALPPGGFRLLTDSELNFAVLDEEPIFLYRPNTNSVVDARIAKRGLRGRLDENWLRPSTGTPGAENQFDLTTDIVINEIMYHHQATNDGLTYAESNEEWVELYNRGSTTISLEGWKFDDGITYDFPIGSSLAPGAYLVVSNFSGSLSNSGERLRLVDSVGNPADEVRYFDGGRWPEYADGGGSSLELRDPFADNSVPEAWAASDEAPKSNWQTYTYEAVASASAVGNDGQWRDFVLGLLDGGEVLLDDISVIEDPYGSPAELISTGDFEGGVGDWRIIGNHRHSEVITDPDDPGNQALKLVASGVTEHMHNHAEITLVNGRSVTNGLTYRISFKAKWITGCRLVNTRLYFNRAAKTTVLDVPMNNGTPDAQNSTFVTNSGPVFSAFQHEPAVPEVGDEVIISAEAADPQGVANIQTWYSVNGGAWISSTMALSNGIYATALPPQTAGSVVQFYVEAEDAQGAASTFPARGADARALYKVDDGLGSLTLHNFQIIMTDADADFMDTDIQLMSNEQLGCTVIFDERDIYYDVGVRLKSSERGRVKDTRIGFRLNFHAEQPFNGVHQSIAIDRSAGQVVGQREMLINMAMNRGGSVLSKYNDLIKVIAPKPEHSSPAELQLARYGDVYLDEQFGADGDGGLFELEYVYYPRTANGEGYKLPAPDIVARLSNIKDLGDDKEAYRHVLMIKNKRAADDFSPVIAFAKKMGLTGDAFNEQIGDVVDVDNWLRNMAYAVANGHADNYSVGGTHNAMFYFKPSDGRAVYLPHDMDFNYSATRAIDPSGDLKKMISTPERERLYYAHMWDILQNVYNVGYMQFWTDQFGALLPNENFASYLTFIGRRHNYLIGEIEARVAPQYPFSVTDAPATVGELSATISGDGWLDVNGIYLEGVDEPLALTWTSSGSGSSRTYQWSAEVPLEPGLNILRLDVYNFQGEWVAAETVVITSTATGDPLKDHLRVTEIMHSPEDGSDYEFIELFNSGTEALNLTGVYFSDGIEFDFSLAGFTNFAPQTHGVITKDLAAFSSRYNTNGMNIAGEYSGKLSDGETLEILGPLNEELVKFEYQSVRGWPAAASGPGHSLVPRVGTFGNDALYYGGNWRASSNIGGSPGQADAPAESALVLSEIAAHTDYSNPSNPEYDSNDWIELYNSSTNDITLNGDWYLSDDAALLTQWPIPVGTVIPAGGHIVFDEVSGFHAPITEGFGLDKAGEQVYLSYLPITGNRYVADALRFKGQENGVSIGRYEDGEAFWYTQTLTPDAENEKPALRPVITEIMFHPISGVTNNTADEYVEIRNPSSSPVELWNESGPWRIDGGIDFNFPSNTTLNAESNLLLVSFDPADPTARGAFLSTYGLSEGEVELMGPFSSSLDNRGERIALERPQAGDLPGEPVSWVIMDEVIYFHQAPWPAGADGTGKSLQRKHTRWAGNDPANWYTAFVPTPGTAAETYGAYGTPDWWLTEINPTWTNNFTQHAADDPDLDGLTTGEEYVAGTDPLLSESTIQLSINSTGLHFQTLEAGKMYNGRERYYSPVQAPTLTADPFEPIPGYQELLGNGNEYVYPLPADTNSARFYRLEINLY